ncbi:ABC transporter permease [Rickettsia endosymbiont of Cardiosporidium cionae]|uniref:ABC transporter permease n=1 Tax=Rickettsia endosymbiont of Cardiosporidium cionae TaxID=2777155 RepID=UPI0018940021|nr:ABC transporter permease [Rickettsia endosymbiont of Cardiosporidium cionae]KAF8818670.1 Spermidine/putrescine transport system permease protein PotB [Rickettsia endosymbiont of Cardiosporidium cionae]
MNILTKIYKELCNTKKLSQIVFFILVIIWLSISFIFPNLTLLLISFFERDEYSIFTTNFTINNYLKLFSSVYFVIFSKTFIISLTVTVICLIISYPFAFYISQNIKNKSLKDILFILIIIPFWTSPLLRSYSIMSILKINGLINQLLIKVGIIQHPIMLLYSWNAMIIGLVYSLLPLMIMPLYIIFEKLQKNYLDAAKDLGATKIDLFYFIITPLSKPGIITGSILVFLSSISMFFIPEMLGGNKDILLGNLIKNKFLISYDWTFGASIINIINFTIIITSYIYSRFYKKS